MKKIMLLGSGELGKEFIISAQRLGCHTIAVDRYPHAPAMQVADDHAVINMQNAQSLKKTVKKFQPDIIVPEIEAIHTETLKEFEKNGIQVVPTAKATHLTMNRDAIRDLAAGKLGLRTARYAYASSLEELKEKTNEIGFPVIVKPVMSSSGKGQSMVKSSSQLKKAWDFAKKGRGERVKVIVEEFIDFTLEITLLTIKQKKGNTLFCEPIGHIQESGDYRESWQPAQLKPKLLKEAQRMAEAVTNCLGGAGLFGVEFFITDKEVIFSELSPRPHDTGMVTLISQNLNEFDLHLRAILGLPIPQITTAKAAASAVVLAKKEGKVTGFNGIRSALETPQNELRLFGKPEAYKGRRLGVVLSKGKDIVEARKLALEASKKIKPLIK